jgi:hypothetical protein
MTTLTTHPKTKKEIQKEPEYQRDVSNFNVIAGMTKIVAMMVTVDLDRLRSLSATAPDPLRGLVSDSRTIANLMEATEKYKADQIDYEQAKVAFETIGDLIEGRTTLAEAARVSRD